MEKITNEIKEMVFAAYFNQKVLHTGTDIVVLDKTWNWKHPDFKLVLKPISQITDEDKEVVEKLEDIDDPYTEGYITWGKTWYEITYKNNNYGYVRPLLLESSQFLQSKGYDLPQYLLSGKTLFECGLCIYNEK